MKTKLLSVILLTMIFQFQLNAQQKTIYFVDADATSGNNDGTNWANAFTSLSEAIDSANALPAMDTAEVWIAEGMYKPEVKDPNNPNEATFHITNNFIRVIGGFSGNETSKSQADPENNETILSGDLNGNDSGIPSGQNSNYYDNVYQIVTVEASEFHAFCHIIGLTFEGGWAVNQKSQGAAIHSNVRGGVWDCIFRNNFGFIDYSTVFVKPKWGNFVFRNNKLYENYGGRSLVGFTKGQRINPANNKPRFEMGRYFCFNNVFYDNTTQYSILFGNQYHLSNSSPSLTTRDMEHYIYNNTFYNNTITDTVQGAPIVLHHQDNSGIYDFKVDVVGNIFWGNNSTHKAIFIRNANSYGAWTKRLERLFFVFNLIDGNEVLSTNNLFVATNPWSNANFSFVDYNIYNSYPMFTDTANRDLNIVDCNAPGVDQVNYFDNSMPSSFFIESAGGGERVKGLRIDIGAYEVQNEFSSLDVEQVDSTLVATPGYEPYTWYNNSDPMNPILLPDTTNVITPSSDGDYIVLANNSSGCSGLAGVNFCASVRVSLGVAGDSLVAAGTGGSLYTFRFEGNVITGANSISHNAIPLEGYGDYQVSHFNSGGAGCTGTSELRYCGGITGLSITRNGNMLEASVQDAANYYWLLNTDTISVGSSSTFDLTGEDDGPYSVFVKENACEGTSNSIYYCSALPDEFDITLTGNNVLNAPTGYNSYQWQLNGTDISGATQQTYSATQSGDYAVIIGIDQNCQGTSNNFEFVLTGINELNTSNSVTLYPNPGNNFFNVQSEQRIKALKIMDLQGKLILEKQIRSNVTQVDVTGLAGGIYLIQVKLAEETKFIKFIKN